VRGTGPGVAEIALTDHPVQFASAATALKRATG
jgi:hypothetical protein